LIGSRSRAASASSGRERKERGSNRGDRERERELKDKKRIPSPWRPADRRTSELIKNVVTHRTCWSWGYRRVDIG